MGVKSDRRSGGVFNVLHPEYCIGHKPELVDFGCDWVTMSWPGEEAARAPHWHTLKALYEGCALTEGQVERDVEQNMQGYAGRRFGHLWYGERKGDALVRVSGAPARYFVNLLGGRRPNITRIDLQMTLRLDVLIDEAIDRLVQCSVAARKGAMGRPWKVVQYKDFGEGHAGYFGGQSSLVCCRVYNKYAESGFEDRYEGFIRFEVEYKKAAAQAVFNELNGWPLDAPVVPQHVALAFSKRGINALDQYCDGRRPLWDLPQVSTDTEKQLAWLEKYVRGTVKKLALDGMLGDVIECLGVDKYVVARDVPPRKE